MCLSFAVFVFSHFWHLGWGPLEHDWVVVVIYYYAIETGLISLSLTCFLFERGPEQESMSTMQVPGIAGRPNPFRINHLAPLPRPRSRRTWSRPLIYVKTSIWPASATKVQPENRRFHRAANQLWVSTQASHGSRVKGFFFLGFPHISSSIIYF